MEFSGIVNSKDLRTVPSCLACGTTGSVYFTRRPKRKAMPTMPGRSPARGPPTVGGVA